MVSVVSVVKAASIACEKMARIGAGNGVNRTGDIWRGGGKGVSLQAEREIKNHHERQHQENLEAHRGDRGHHPHGARHLPDNHLVHGSRTILKPPIIPRWEVQSDELSTNPIAHRGATGEPRDFVTCDFVTLSTFQYFLIKDSKDHIESMCKISED